MQERFWGHAYTSEIKMDHCPLCLCLGATHIKLSDLITGNTQIHLLFISEPGSHYDDLFLSNNITVSSVVGILQTHEAQHVAWNFPAYTEKRAGSLGNMLPQA